MKALIGVALCVALAAMALPFGTDAPHRALGQQTDADDEMAAAPLEDLVTEFDALLQAIEAGLADEQAFADEDSHLLVHAATAAVLAHAIGKLEGDGAPVWHDRAFRARDAARELAAAVPRPAEPGVPAVAGDLAAARSAYDKLRDILAATAPDAPADELEWHQIVPLHDLMLAIQHRNHLLLPLHRDQNGFRAGRNQAAGHLSVLLVLATAARHDLSAAGDDPLLQQDWANLSDALNRELTGWSAAVRASNFDGARDAYRLTQRACANCHAVFRIQ